jgi:hypothetical protein
MSDWSESPNVTEETYNAVQWGKKLERERIINLIGDKFECIQHYDCEPKINITCSEMYALIKGDSK